MNRIMARRILTALLWVSLPLSAQPKLIVDSLFSQSLSSTIRFSILLPGGYDASNRYPVLFLLHGYDGGHTDWTSRTALVSFMDGLSLIIVMPDAGNSWYVNSHSNPSRRIEDFLLTDLTIHLIEQYSVDEKRQAVAGLSMGGFGAVMLAMKHPQRFRFAGSLSGALSVPGDIDFWEDQPWGKRLAPNLKETFGSAPNAFRDAHNPFLLVKNLQSSSSPYLYLVMGTNDGFVGFLPAHRMLADTLRAHDIPYEYHEVPGGHSWEFWGRTVRPMIERMMDFLK